MASARPWLFRPHFGLGTEAVTAGFRSGTWTGPSLTPAGVSALEDGKPGTRQPIFSTSSTMMPSGPRT
jgi:hypothetical protein